MTVVQRVLFVGYVAFLIVGVAWHGWQVLGDFRSGRPVPPRRYLIQRSVLLTGNIVWLALIGLSSGGSLLSLAFTFLLCIIPTMGMSLVSGYRADKRRYEVLTSRDPGNRPQEP